MENLFGILQNLDIFFKSYLELMKFMKLKEFLICILYELDRFFQVN